jgi:hypothetical protein
MPILTRLCCERGVPYVIVSATDTQNLQGVTVPEIEEQHTAGR